MTAINFLFGLKIKTYPNNKPSMLSGEEDGEISETEAPEFTVGDSIPLDGNWNDDVLIQAWDAAIDEYKTLAPVSSRISAEVAPLNKGRKRGANAEGRNTKRKVGRQDENSKIKNEIQEETAEIKNPGLDQPLSYTTPSMASTFFPVGQAPFPDISITNSVTGHSDGQPRESHQPESSQPKESQEPQSHSEQQSDSKEATQDELVANMMMSWYYAGYYTGLYQSSRK